MFEKENKSCLRRRMARGWKGGKRKISQISVRKLVGILFKRGEKRPVVSWAHKKKTETHTKKKRDMSESEAKETISLSGNTQEKKGGGGGGPTVLDMENYTTGGKKRREPCKT